MAKANNGMGVEASKEMRITLPSGGTATVSKDVRPETVEALDQMCKAAVKAHAKSAYYNENDPKKAASLRELIGHNLIAPGEVDERSIDDVRPGDVAGFDQCHFFAGVGIWSYALRLAGWPDNRPVWTGSCPCPSFSAAGKGEGFEDARHLWPAWYRLIRECRPAAVFGEQVAAAIGFGWLDLVQTDMEAETYSLGKIVLGACSVGSPHRRQRLYFVADSADSRRDDSGKHGSGPPLLSARSEQCGDALSGSESLHAERRSLNEHREDGCDGEDNGRPEAHGLTGAHGEVCERSNANGRDTSAEGLQRSGQFRLRAEDGGSNGIAGNGQQSEVGYRGDSAQRGFRMYGSASGSSGHPAQPDETGDGVNSFQSRLEGHFGDVRDWRGPGWLDPLTARSVAEAGATRGFWADCDWWYGRDGKYRPIGTGLFPLAHGAPERVGRLSCYGDGIVPQVAQAFIKAYLEANQ